MSGSSNPSPSGTPPGDAADRTTQHALVLLRELLHDLEHGNKSVVRFMISDEETYSLMVEAAYARAPDDADGRVPQCPRCGATNIVDVGANTSTDARGDRLCLVCNASFSA